MIRWRSVADSKAWIRHWIARQDVPSRRERFILFVVRLLCLRGALVADNLFRFYLLSHSSWLGRILNRGLYLHYIFKGDDDRDLHNHPWYDSKSLILVGGYLEQLAKQTDWGFYVVTRPQNPGAINRIRRDTYHRIHMSHGPCWTLFYSGERVDRVRGEDWSFLNVRTGQKTLWKDYK